MRACCRFPTRVGLRRVALAGWLAAAVCVAGPAVAGELSLDEALALADSLTTGAFAAPPRTIADITRLLEQHQTTPSAQTRQEMDAADAPLPDTRKAGKLMKFYTARGQARRNIGRTEEALEDLLAAVEYMQRANPGPDRRTRVLQQLAFAQAAAGRYRSAVETMHLVLEHGDQPGAYRLLVKLLGSQGDLEGMENARRQGREAIERRLRGRGTSHAQRMDLRIDFLRMEHAVHQTLGQWVEAEKAIRLAISYGADSEKAGRNPSWLPARQRDLAAVLLRQGRLAEAEVIARTALTGSLDALGRDSGTTADSLRMLANVIHAEGRYDEAEVLVREAIAIQTRMGIPPATGNLAKSRRTLLGILIAREDWAGAVVEFDALNAGGRSDGEKFRSMLLKRPEAAIALLHVGREQEALELLEIAVERSRERLGEKHFDTALQTGFLAAARTRMGDFERALEEFGGAVPILLSRSRQSDDEEDASDVGRQVTFVLEAYMQALANGRPTSARMDEAFRIAEAARDQSVQRALGESGARAAANDPQLAELARREQDARKQIATFYALLANVLNAPADERNDSAIASLRERIDDLRDARATFMEQIEARFPEYASLVDPKPASVDSARATLRADEALISTYVGADGSFVWAVPKQGAVRFVAVDMDREDLADVVGLLRAALEPGATSIAEVPAFDVDLAHALYLKLLAPVREGWASAHRLVIAAHGPLGYLPLSVLPTAPGAAGDDGATPFSGYRDVAWLARSHAVTLVPSVAALRTLRSLPAAKPGRQAFLGFGDPIFDWQTERGAAAGTAAGNGALVMRSAPTVTDGEHTGLSQLPPLADTADELRAIAASMGLDADKAVVLGAQATEEQVKQSSLDGYRIIAFATHGLTPGELGGLTEPALALTAPREASGGEDGLLTMNEILGLKLDADWVVLSACNTASGEGAGAEAVSGLGRAFFYAGTRALLVSNWPVQTSSARALTTAVFRRQAEQPELPRAEALRQAMLEMIDHAGLEDGAGKLRFSYAHPLFWAPFSLFGDGG